MGCYFEYRQRHRESLINMLDNVSPLVSTDMLVEKIDSKRIRILDASWYPSISNRDAREEFHGSHIPGASFFDLTDCSDKSTDLIFMLPDASTFSNYVGNLGIDNNTHVIVYDNDSKFGALTAGRLWWMFRVYGHERVSILDGGLAKWMSENKPVTKEIANYTSKLFECVYNPALIKSYDQMIENLKSDEFQVIDVRPEIGEGSIIGSTQVPFVDYLDKDTKTFRDPDELKLVLSSAGIDLNKPMASYCKLAVSSCLLSFVSVLCDLPIIAVYDGAWQEWSLKANSEHIKC